MFLKTVSKYPCGLVDLSSHFGVSHVAVNRIVTKLAKEGLLATEPYQPILLTSDWNRGKQKHL